MEKNIIKKSMRKKISLAMIIVALTTLLIVSVTYSFVIFGIRENMIESNGEMGSMTESLSSESMKNQITEQLLDMSEGKADLANSIFLEFERNVQLLANTAQKVYDDPDKYPERSIPLPDAANDGKLSMQLLFSEKTDQTDEAIIHETGILGNLQDVLVSVNENNENMVSDYIASETGIMLQADYIAAKKFDENGNIMPYEAATRPWYIGAKETGKPYYTNVSKDAHTSRTGIMCGVPIFSKGKLMGVAGAGMCSLCCPISSHRTAL